MVLEGCDMKRILLLMGLVLVIMAGTMPAIAQDGSQPLPTSFKLDISRLRHVYQNWNNCSGATISMGLSYYGYPLDEFGDQERARLWLKPDREDQNVSPWQLVKYVNEQVGAEFNVKSVARRGGDLELLKRLVSANYPVIIEKGYEVEDVEGWMGHYLLIIGYDDAAQIFYTYDSYLGHGNLQGRQESYTYITTYWQHFNNAFIVLYPPNEESNVQAIMGPMWDETTGWLRSWEQSAALAALNADDYWAWFNLGEAATALGDYETATQAFTVAFDSGKLPWRILWYMHGPFEAFYQTGKFEAVLRFATSLQEVTSYIEEANYYRGLVYAAQGNTDQALYRLNLVLDFNPNFTPAAEAKAQIEAGTFVGPAQTD